MLSTHEIDRWASAEAADPRLLRSNPIERPPSAAAIDAGRQYAMKAIEIAAFGGPENLQVVERPLPELQMGEALVAVEAAGVGYGDVMVRQGLLAGLADIAPGAIPGVEVSGTVVAVHETVDPAWRGRRVLALLGDRGGGYAEFAACSVRSLAVIPTLVTAAQAVAVGVNGLVAACSLDRARVVSGERVLVRGACGGIGVMATQLAARRSVTVVGTASSPERGERLRGLGAKQVLDRAGLADGEEPDGFDVIVDAVAGQELMTFLGRLNPNGRMVLVGAAGGLPDATFGLGLIASFQRSITLSTFSANTIDPSKRVSILGDLLALVGDQRIEPIVDDVFPLDRARDAHAKLESGSVFGKVVLTGNLDDSAGETV